MALMVVVVMLLHIFSRIGAGRGTPNYRAMPKGLDQRLMIEEVQSKIMQSMTVGV